MKKLVVMLAVALTLFLVGCEENEEMTFYDHALTLANSEYILREDGTVWHIPKRGSEMEYVREYDGEFSTKVKKKNAEDMELWEFALAGWADKCIGICQDGSVWRFPYTDYDDSSAGYAYKWEPVGELVPHEGFWIEIEEIGVNPYYEKNRGETHPVIFWTLHDDSGELYNPLLTDLEVLIGDEWYWAAGYTSDTLDVKHFDANGEYRGGSLGLNMTALVTGLDGGLEDVVSVPSGHYRLKASAYIDRYAENQKHDWSEKYLRHAVIEFDLEYKNGEYKIKNIKN